MIPLRDHTNLATIDNAALLEAGAALKLSTRQSGVVNWNVQANHSPPRMPKQEGCA